MGTESEEQRVAVVIEDDDDIRNLLQTVLTQGGFQVIAAGNAQDGIEAVRRYNPVVTTLDVNMPGMDGFEAARRIRTISSSYIVMLTALSEEIDTLQGLDAGADDFITKPFRPRELRARIEALLRRPRQVVGSPDAPVASPAPAAPVVAPSAPVEPPEAPAKSQAPAPVQASTEPAATPESPVPPLTADADGWTTHQGLSLNAETRVVQADGAEIDLTRSEFDLLAALMASGRRVRTKADLVLVLRNESYVTSHFISDADKRAIEVHVANLRKKLADNAASPRWVETVRGIGYRMTAAE